MSEIWTLILKVNRRTGVIEESYVERPGGDRYESARLAEAIKNFNRPWQNRTPTTTRTAATPEYETMFNKLIQELFTGDPAKETMVPASLASVTFSSEPGEIDNYDIVSCSYHTETLL